jgi:LEA14-like dessication related protein
MRNMIKTTLVCVLLLAIQGCSWMRQEFHDPDIKVVGFSNVKGGNLLKQRFALTLELTNPNDLELDVKGMTFTLAIAGIDIMQGVSDKVPVIKPYSTTEFTVEGSANVIQAMRLLHKMQKKIGEDVNYTLNTRIDLRHGWPSSFNLKREGKISLDEWLGKQ